MAPTLLDVAELACRRGGRPVFDRLSFALGAGELLALTGRNGSGKTTLLRALALLVRGRGRHDPLAGRQRAGRSPRPGAASSPGSAISTA